MIRITRKPEPDSKTLTVAGVQRFLEDCAHAGITPDTVVNATITIGSKLKSLAAEG